MALSTLDEKLRNNYWYFRSCPTEWEGQIFLTIWYFKSTFRTHYIIICWTGWYKCILLFFFKPDEIVPNVSHLRSFRTWSFRTWLCDTCCGDFSTINIVHYNMMTWILIKWLVESVHVTRHLFSLTRDMDNDRSLSNSNDRSLVKFMLQNIILYNK